MIKTIFLKLKKEIQTKSPFFLEKIKFFYKKISLFVNAIYQHLSLRGRHYTASIILLISLIALLLIFEETDNLASIGILITLILLGRMLFHHFSQTIVTPKVIIQKHRYLPLDKRGKWSELISIRHKNILERIFTFAIHKEIIFTFKDEISAIKTKIILHPLSYEFIPILRAIHSNIIEHKDKKILEAYLAEQENFMKLFKQIFKQKMRSPLKIKLK